MLDRSARFGRGHVELGLDCLLVGVAELALAAEELDAVVLGRVVRGSDDDAEVVLQGGKRDGAARQHAADDRGRAGGDDPLGESGLEGDPGGARVAADEDGSRAAPGHRRAAEPLDEVCGQELARDPTNTVSPEVPAGHGPAG